MYKILMPDVPRHRMMTCEIGKIVVFEEADIALLDAAIPDEEDLRAQPVIIGGAALPLGARVALYGFPNTKHEVRPGLPDRPGLGLAFDSAFNEGEVIDRLANGSLLPGNPVYVTSCEAPPGMSGAPLINLETGLVHGVLSSSIPGSHSVCTDIGAILERIRKQVDPKVKGRIRVTQRV
jgi:hypothetical protein